MDINFLREGKWRTMDFKKINPEQLLKGIKVEHEHTENDLEAMKIALDHIAENPKYYDIIEVTGL